MSNANNARTRADSSLWAKVFYSTGNVLTLNNKLNLSPASLRRLGLVGLVSSGIAGYELQNLGNGSTSSGNAVPKERVVYPYRTERQLDALPDQGDFTAKQGDDADSIIEEGNPGLLNSTVPGSLPLIGELEVLSKNRRLMVYYKRVNLTEYLKYQQQL